MEFIQVLRRFFTLRGVPSIMISDNWTQFMEAERQLRELIEGWDKEKLREYSAEKGMSWQFSTPKRHTRMDEQKLWSRAARLRSKKQLVTKYYRPWNYKRVFWRSLTSLISVRLAEFRTIQTMAPTYVPTTFCSGERLPTFLKDRSDQPRIHDSE